MRLVRMGAAGSRNIAATVLRSAGGGRGCREEQRGYRDGYVDAAHPLAEGPRCRGPSGRPKDAWCARPITAAATLAASAPHARSWRRR